MELPQYKNLLDQVNAINARYKKINELTGENFNVFRILKLESSEVKMHNAFIAELLNPNGSHGQKDTFLKLFINAFCFKGNLIDSLSCKVKVEGNLGKISEDKLQGGRVDIQITDNHNHQIIIENKIYAGDQENQLTRYFNSAPNADIIYLTLYGMEPSETSRGELKKGEHYKCCSYKHDILNWLELCRKEVTVYPIVREAITHYINTIKYLTNQTLNHNMEEELSDLLKANLEASWAISNNLDKACEKISDDFGKELEQELNKIELLCDYGINFQNRYCGIWIWKPEWKHLSIGFQFQNRDKDFIYGFVQETDDKLSIPVDVRDKISSLPNNASKVNDWWPWYRQLESPYNDWSKLEAWQTILMVE